MSERPYDDAVLAPPEPRARSPPDDSTSGDRKRRRKVLSCFTCRRRKLQCDRVSPTCGRCKSAGQSSSCIYSEDTAKPSVKPRQYDDSPTDVLQTAKHQRLRIQHLEAALARRSDSVQKDVPLRLEALDFPPTPMSAHQHELNVKINDRETMLIRGKSFKTQFSGTTHPLGTIAHIPELNLFTKEALEMYPTFQHAKQDIASLEAQIKCADKDSFALADEKLHTLLPPQADVDNAVQEYFDSYERIYHIMHAPSFWQAYQEMWQIGVEKASRHTLVGVGAFDDIGSVISCPEKALDLRCEQFKCSGKSYRYHAGLRKLDQPTESKARHCSRLSNTSSPLSHEADNG
jgi:hypothetical protein